MNATTRAVLMAKIRAGSNIINKLVPYGTANATVKTLCDAQDITWNVPSADVSSGRLVLSAQKLFQVTATGATNVIGVLIINSQNTNQSSPYNGIAVGTGTYGIKAPDDSPIALETGDYVRVTALTLGIDGA
jgi:hypothetical protein